MSGARSVTRPMPSAKNASWLQTANFLGPSHTRKFYEPNTSENDNDEARSYLKEQCSKHTRVLNETGPAFPKRQQVGFWNGGGVEDTYQEPDLHMPANVESRPRVFVVHP